MRSKAYAYLLGMVAILAGLALLAFSPSQLIDIFGGAALLGGIGATAWASGGMSVLRMYIGALLITALIGGSLVQAQPMFGSMTAH